MPIDDDLDGLLEALNDPTPGEARGQRMTPGEFRSVAVARERERLRSREREDIYSRGRRGLSQWDTVAATEGDVDLTALEEDIKWQELKKKEDVTNLQDLTISNANEFFQLRIEKLLRARATFLRLGHGASSETVQLCSQEIEVFTKLNELMGMGLTLSGAAHFYTHEDHVKSFPSEKVLRVTCDGSRWYIYWDEERKAVFIEQDSHKEPGGVETYNWPEHAEALPKAVREEAAHFYQVEFQRRNPSRWSEL